ncbi:hypothetical protein L873DRAFT_1803761 [Choiromyces venosus 120613-1]|uniref:Uncharacterized protein n=1 Tax=Choiromyces venosus 120613-1 TaxID=1336337 RepID=A0A3N4K5S9_9PEZI|nr:hypothetical protein L873DRAFT_1803761 [Choiromyces venosus 120613-1]
MDIFTNSLPGTYVTGIKNPFMMPIDKGGIPAIAMKKRDANYIVSAYTIMVIFIFAVGWNLSLLLVLSFWPMKKNRNRQIALVALRNSEPVGASWMMMGFCKNMALLIKDTKSPSKDPANAAPGAENTGSTATGGVTHAGLENDRNLDAIHHQNNGEKRDNESRAGTPTPHRGSNLCWGIVFLCLTVAMSVGKVAAGVLITGGFLMGNVAPAQKDAIFYPDVSYDREDNNPTGRTSLTSLKAPAALRIIGAIEASDVAVRTRVDLDRIPAPNSEDPTKYRMVNYAYNVTRVDMGLQSDPGLALRVTGSCRTEYGWLVNHTDTEDVYKLWGEDEIRVQRQAALYLPPMATFRVRNKDVKERNVNMSYAIMVNTAGRYSYTSSQDPWYATKNTGNNTQIAYTVLEERPALSCWETSFWHFGGHVESNIRNLPGLKLHELWKDTVFPQEFSAPRLTGFGVEAGSSALRSASYTVAPSYILDAGLSNIVEDLERLILASWVSSRNVVRDTTSYKSGGTPNVARGKKGSVEDGAAQFVLQSADVGTLSLRILIAIPAILLFLLVVKMTLDCIIEAKDLRQPSVFGDEERNATALLATQIFRLWDEQHDPRAKWNSYGSGIPVQSFCTPSEETIKTSVNPKSITQRTTTGVSNGDKR